MQSGSAAKGLPPLFGFSDKVSPPFRLSSSDKPILAHPAPVCQAFFDKKNYVQNAQVFEFLKL